MTSDYYLEPTVPDLSLVPTNPDFGQKLEKLNFGIDSSDGNNIFLILVTIT
jgi:hypothetical protein